MSRVVEFEKGKHVDFVTCNAVKLKEGDEIIDDAKQTRKVFTKDKWVDAKYEPPKAK